MILYSIFHRSHPPGKLVSNQVCLIRNANIASNCLDRFFFGLASDRIVIIVPSSSFHRLGWSWVARSLTRSFGRRIRIPQGTIGRGFCEPCQKCSPSHRAPLTCIYIIYKGKYLSYRTPPCFSLALIFISCMTPYFIRNLVPRRQALDANRRPLSEVLLSLTGTQWAQFLTGHDPFRI